MSKYQELCENFKKTEVAFNKSKAFFEQSFKQKLSNYLGCEANKILLDFSDPKLLDPQKRNWEYYFKLQIILETEKHKEPPSFPLTCSILSQEEDKYDFFVEHTGYTYDLNDKEGINELFDTIVKDLEDHFILYK